MVNILLKRLMNVLLCLILTFCVPILFMGNKIDSKAVETFLLFLTIGLAVVGALNYILFGKLTLWHKD